MRSLFGAVDDGPGITSGAPDFIALLTVRQDLGSICATFSQGSARRQSRIDGVHQASMLFESIVFDAEEALPELGENHVFRYCSFLPRENLALGIIDGVFIGCTFQGLDFYWTLFNDALVLDSRFDACTFGGAHFSSSRFVDCSLEKCAFEIDAFGEECDLQESRWYACAQEGSTGIDSAIIPYRSPGT